MRKAVLFIAVLAVAALVVFLWPDEPERGPEAAAPTIGRGETESARSPQSNRPLEAAEPVAGPATRETPAARTLVEESEPETVATERPEPETEPPLEDGIEILVVHQETGAAVPQADIYFLNPQSLAMDEVMLEFQVEGLNFEKLLRVYGRRFRADDEGRLFVPRGTDVALVAGSKGDLWGMTQLDTGMDEPIRLELGADPSVEVHVVDTLGNPVAGVPVALRMKRKGAQGGMQGGVPDLNKVLTDRSGKAVISRFRRILEEMNDGARDWVPHVAITAMLAEPVEQEIDPDDLPADPIVLVMPPTGEVEILLEGFDGEPFTKQAFVMLSPASNEADEARPARAMMGQGGAMAMAEDGRVLFSHVGLGLQLAVVAGTMESNEPVEESIDGPVSAGQRVTLRLALTSDAPVLVARLLDEDGEPFRETVVQISLWQQQASGGSSSQNSGLRTDENGLVRMPLRDDEVAPGDTRTVTFAMTPDAGTELGARLDLSWTLPPGETDLGDVVLRPKPLLVSGTVTDQDGDPIAGAGVRLHRVSWVNPDDGEVRWTRIRQARTSSGGDGGFEVHGWIENERMAVSAEHASFRSGERVEVRAGTKGVRLQLEGAGRIAGRLLVDPGIEPGRHVQVHLADPAGETVNTRRSNQKDGAFELRQVPPGVWSLVIRAGESELERIEGIRVRAGETATVDDIDLRGRLHRMRIDVVDVDGNPLSNIRLSWRPAGDESAQPRLDNAWRGFVELVSEHVALDIEVFAVGYRTARLEGVGSDRTVVLQPGIPIRLILRGELPSLGPEYSLQTSTRYDEEDRGYAARARAAFDSRGEAKLAVSEPGRYRVGISVRRSSGNSSSSMSLHGFKSVMIEVEDSSYEQIFEIDVSGADFAKALEYLSGD
ncbi:MAG: hypothetical protein O7B99_06380 [Planctomycetota bacterium]|nr:hypothetical protein [Planctomycetota bacterium]